MYIHINKKSYIKNKHKHVESKRNYERSRIKTDIIYKMRKHFSCSIFNALRKNGGNKNRGSILTKLPYTIKELKKHIESLFEPWMNWRNWGAYSNKWDDNDQSTWTWNIDHIIPQCKLPYTSMDDDNFKKCWALSNLRPLSSKQNVTERHIRDV